ncbi:butyrophilin subfamily 3 member A2-like [Myripristis murdjan]|uniref:butyrophilin subfamily 3 member A2-like n=1 Tax=Myripristis murdjan TaxID=586833 RepID=UPI001175F7CE|nr:butyrophilin subfamily 3 member A2-like [Myripristis murdjan]
MSLLKTGLSRHSQLTVLTVFSVLVLHHSAVFLLLTHSCAGQSQLIGPDQPILSILGDDIILPCQLDPVLDATGMTVEWARPDLNPRFVYLWRDGYELLVDQNPTYEGRASLFRDKLELGDVSLKLSGVKISDEGRYRCFIPLLGIETTAELVVGAASSPVVIVTKSSSGVVLECESKGWYPEPELFWLDAEGKLLSAGAPETVRGPDGLYTVSSRVTVEKSHSNSFTCRVQQSKIQQTRETQIHIPDDFFMVTSGSSVPIFIILAVGFLFVAAAVCLVCKWKRDKIKTKICDEEEGAEKTKFINNYTENHAVIEGEGDGELGKTDYLPLAGEEKSGEDSDNDSFKSASSHFQGEGQETDADSQTKAEVGRDQEQHMRDRQQRELDRKEAELEQPQKTTQQREESEGTPVMETKTEDNNEKAENNVDLEKTEKQRDEKLQSVSGEETWKETEKTDLKTQQEAAGSGNQELQQATGLQVDSSKTETENQENLQDRDQDAERRAETNETDMTGEDQGGWENDANCVTDETEVVHGRKTSNGTAERTGEPERST